MSARARTSRSRAATWLARGAGLVLPVLLVPGLARADLPASAERADYYFRLGQQELEAGDIEHACANLSTSYGYEKALGTLLNLAYCHERQGHFASAWREYSEAAAEAGRAGKAERASFAAAHAQALESRVSRVRIATPPRAGGASGSAGAYAIVDEARVPIQADGTFLVDPGLHTVVVVSGARTSRPRRIAVPTTAAIVGITPAFEEEATPAPTPNEPAVNREILAKSGSDMRRTVGFVAAGVGSVAIGAGAVFGLMTIAKKNDADAACGSTSGDHACPTSAQRDAANGARAQADTDALVADVAVGVGLAAIAAGVYLLLTGDSEPAAKAPPDRGLRAKVAPMTACGAARGAGAGAPWGMSLEGAW